MNSNYKHTHTNIIEKWLKDTSQVIEIKKSNGKFEQVSPCFLIMDMNRNIYRLKEYKSIDGAYI